MTPRPTEPTPFSRIIVTPLIVLIAAVLIGSVTGNTLFAIAVGAFISILYVLVASSRGKPR